MAFIYDDGDVSVHIEEGNKLPEAKCFDSRDEEMQTSVNIDLLTMFPTLVLDTAEIPNWRFVIDSIQSVAHNNDTLWSAWDILSKLPLL